MVYTVVEISVFELRNIVITGGIHQIFFNASNIFIFSNQFQERRTDRG